MRFISLFMVLALASTLASCLRTTGLSASATSTSPRPTLRAREASRVPHQWTTTPPPTRGSEAASEAGLSTTSRSPPETPDRTRQEPQPQGCPRESQDLPQRLLQAQHRVEKAEETLEVARKWNLKAIKEVVEETLPHLLAHNQELVSLARKTAQSRSNLVLVREQLDCQHLLKKQLQECEAKVAKVKEIFRSGRKVIKE